MNAKKRKHLKSQFDALTKAQLVALAVQKNVLPFLTACDTSKEDLVAQLIDVEGVLKPVQA